ncbi:MAG: TonB-dependent receptor [Bryobacterales bacterium]|nr:TonB-dependent receptor [Bryobacterales bacterium]
MKLLYSLCLVVLCTALSWGQTTFGTIRGRVLDPSGAPIAGAKVVVTNQGTNISKETTASEIGAYEVGYLQPGTYLVGAEFEGFQRFVTEGLVLSANAVILVDARLQVGEVSTSITVEAGAPLINTETAVISDIKTAQQYLQAPMNLRGNWDSYIFAFMSLVPGAQPTLNSFSISFAGTRYTMNNFTVDGITTNSTLYGNQVGPANPSMDFIREVKVDMSGNSAEFSAPGHVNVVSKGGENQFHGSAYEYYNTAGLNARSFFAARRNFTVMNNYGFTISGPVVRNKTFFSAGMEGFNQRTGAQLNLNLPSDRVRTGDFSQLKDSRGHALVITDPSSRSPFPGAVIPASRLNASALRLQERFFPRANFGDPESVALNYNDFVKQNQRKEQVDLRLDHQLSSVNSLYGRFSMMRAPNNVLDGNLPTIGLRLQRRQARNLVISDTHIFRPNLINEFRFGWTRGYNPFSGPVMGRSVVQELGLTNLPSELPDVAALPIIGITGFQGVSQLDVQRGDEMIFQWQDNVSWIIGRHTIKFGGELWHNRGENFAVSPSRAYGSVNFTGAFTGNGYADLLLGVPFSASRSASGFVNVTSTNYDKSLFITDEYKIHPRLTLNFGVRYEVNPPYTSGDLMYSFNPFTGNMVVPNERSIQQLYPQFVSNNLVSIVTAREAGLPSTLAYTDTNNFAPRFGFAYKLTEDNKTVLRGGYGIFYDSFTASLWRTLTGGPYNGTENAPPNSFSNGVPAWQWPAMFPSNMNQAGAASMGGIDPHMKTPYVQQWSLTVEREIFDMGVRLSYQGSKTHQMGMSQNLNQVQPSLTPFSTSRRMYPQLSSVNWRSNMGNAYYNGLTASVERKFKSGLQYQTSYIWAKNLTDIHGEGEVVGGLQNQYDRDSEWADYQYTRRHRFVLNAIYDLPFGKGRKFVQSGLAEWIAGGWSLSTFALLQTGPYFTPTFAGRDPANIGASSGRPDRIAEGSVSDPTNGRWFDPSAFVIPATGIGRFGNSGVNILRGPGTQSMNLGLYKQFHLSERFRLRMEGTFTNLLNRANFAAPDAVLSSGSVGRINATQGLEGAGGRTTRVGLRLDF